jgi:hypothetical protein
MSLPLTRPAPWTEVPANAGMEPLFDELAPLAASPVEVIVTVPNGGSRRCLMDVVVGEADAARAFAVAFELIRDADDFEVTARRFASR